MVAVGFNPSCPALCENGEHAVITDAELKYLLQIESEITIGPWQADGEEIHCPTSDTIKIDHPRYHSHKYCDEAVKTIEFIALLRNVAHDILSELSERRSSTP